MLACLLARSIDQSSYQPINLDSQPDLQSRPRKLQLPISVSCTITDAEKRLIYATFLWIQFDPHPLIGRIESTVDQSVIIPLFELIYTYWANITTVWINMYKLCPQNLIIMIIRKSVFWWSLLTWAPGTPRCWAIRIGSIASISWEKNQSDSMNQYIYIYIDWYS
jgi:hypothetical protein